MIMDDVLDRLCPVGSEENEIESIKAELDQEGFVITNYNKGGIFYHLIRIFVTIYIQIKMLCREIISNSTVTNADEDWLEIKAPDFGKARKQPVKAQGYITITRSDYASALQIAKGHMFKTSPIGLSGKELKYYAVETTVIGAGIASGKVLVEAEESGTDYNVAPDTITKSMIHLDGVETVTNAEGWLHLEGSDIEGTEEFRKRIRESWSELAELTTEDKLKNVARNVSGVMHVEVDAQHPRGQGTTDIIITGSEGEASEELLRMVEEKTRYLKGNYDDFFYKSAVIVRQDIRMHLYIAKDETTDGVDQVARSIIGSMMQLSNRTELNCMYMDDVRYALKKGIQNYKRAEFESPVEDIELDAGKVVMLGELEVTVHNVGGA